MALSNSKHGTKPGKPTFSGGRGGVAHTKCNTQMKVEKGFTSLAAPAVCPINAFLGRFGGYSSMSSAGAVTPQLYTTRGGSSELSMMATNRPSEIGPAPAPNAVQGTKRSYSAIGNKTQVSCHWRCNFGVVLSRLGNESVDTHLYNVSSESYHQPGIHIWGTVCDPGPCSDQAAATNSANACFAGR